MNRLMYVAEEIVKDVPPPERFMTDDEAVFVRAAKGLFEADVIAKIIGVTEAAVQRLWDGGTHIEGMPPLPPEGRNLTDEEVQFIRSAKGVLVAGVIAEIFGVSKGTIRRVWNGHSYKGVE